MVDSKINALYHREEEGLVSEEEALRRIREYEPSTEPTPGIPAEPEPVITTNLEERVIDVYPADSGKVHSQDQWIAYFNERKRVMVSMSDIYMAGKLGDPALLASLQKDFKESWMVMSTRIEYGAGLDARIIHNYGSKVVQPIVIPVTIPEYRLNLLDDVLQTREGLHFMQVFFGTNDSDQQIKDTLKRLSNSPLDKIKVWSAIFSNRPTMRAFGFGYSFSEFLIYDGILLNGNGRARGVFSNPR